MKTIGKHSLVLLLAALGLEPGQAQILLGAGPYSQNFNSLATNNNANLTWSDNSTLPGWYASKTSGGTTVTTYRGGTGSDNTGAIYSFGSLNSTDRALGSTASGTPGDLAFGVRFTNNTASLQTNFFIGYTGEQWRNGGNTNTQTLAFSYQVSSSALTNSEATNTTHWTSFTNLDFNGPTVGASLTALDGNLATNRQVFSSVLVTGLRVSPGQELFLRWLDINDTGNDHGLAIDDLTVNFSTLSNQAPLILSQPQSRTNAVSDTATFSVSVFSAQPPGYRWRLNGSDLSNGGRINGATNQTLTITNVQTTDAGDYSVLVTNGVGGVTSAPATLTVTLALADALDTSNLVWSSGGDATWFGQTNLTHDGADAAASGFITHNQESWVETTVTNGPRVLGFWWRVSSQTNGDFLEFYTNGLLQTRISGESDWQQRSLAYLAPTQTFRWRYVKNASATTGSDQAWLDEVTITSGIAPAFPVPPTNQFAVIGGDAAFSATASGTDPLSYQWQFNGIPLSGRTNTTLSLTNVQSGDAGDYTLVATNYFGALTSSVAPLTIISISLEEALDTTNLVWTTGGNAAWFGQNNVTQDGVDAARSGVITNSQESWVETTVTNGPNSILFWWRVSSETNFDFLEFYINGVLQTRISGESGWLQTALSYPAGSQALRWRYAKDISVAKGSDRGWLDEVAFGAGSAPAIVTQPTNQTVAAGNNATFSVTATGTDPLRYQWRLNNVNLAGRTGTGFVLTDVQSANAGDYTVVVTNAAGAITSQVATLTVTPAPLVITTQPRPQTGFPGNSANFFSAARGTEPIAYQWQFNGTNLPGATSATLFLPSLDYSNAGSYRAVISNSLGTTNTVSALLSVLDLLPWGVGSGGQTNIAADATNAIAIATGEYHGLALRFDGTVTAWGDNFDGETNVPPNATNVIAIAAGYNFCLVVKSNGTVVGWGETFSGKTNIPPAATNVVAVGVGDAHCIALRNNGTILAWGNGTGGVTNVPGSATNVIAISTLNYHDLALRSNGTVVAWGLNTDGQTNVPSGLSNVVAVGAGGHHSLALKSDGTLVAWGNNDYGQTNIPSKATNIIAIAACGFHNLALRSDGVLIAWGKNDAGEATVPPAAKNILAISGNYAWSLALIGQPLRFDATPPGFQMTPSGLKLRLTGLAGRGPVQIQASSNLVSWQSIFTNAPSKGPLDFTDSSATNRPSRYYRASEAR